VASMMSTRHPARLQNLAVTPLDQGVREFLVITLAGESYGMELKRVREILSPPTITLVPRAPSDVVGICSVRGMLVTVFDLRKRLKLELRPTTRLSRVLLSESSSGEVVGLLVDDVKNVVRLAADEVELAQSILGGDLSDYVLGVGRPIGEPIILLDQRRLTE
jgi:chemotaxis signal transduction protein